MKFDGSCPQNGEVFDCSDPELRLKSLSRER